MTWKKVRLGDVADSCLGKMLDQEKNRGEYQPYLANVNVRWGSFDLENLPQMRFLESEEDRYGLKYGDLIVCEGGEPGRCAIWKEQVPNMKFQKALHRVRVHNNVDYRYLFYWFLFAGKRGALDQYFTGATIKHMPGDKMKSIILDLPPLEQQKKIADVLSAYDDLIENNQKQIKLLEEAAQRLYKEWFIDLRFPGHESTPIVNGLPEGWKQTTVATVTTVLRRGVSPFYSEKGASTVINQKCIRKTIVDFDESKKQDKEYPTELNIQDSDTVICSTGAGTLGRVGQIFGNHDKTTIDSHVTLVRSSSAIGKQFLFWAIKSQQPFLQEMGKGSTNQLELSRDVIKSLPILLPNSDVIGKFESETQAIHNKMIVLNEQTLSLQLIRNQLLPRLMSGNMEV